VARSTGESNRNELLSGIPWVVGSVLLMTGLGFLWWAFLSPGSGGGISAITIPETTAARIAAGEPTIGIPSEVVIVRSGVLRVINRDAVPHTLGGSVVDAGETVEVTVDEGKGELASSFNTSGSLTYSVVGRGSLFLTVIVLGLVFGLPMGVIVAVAVAVGRRIGFGEEASA
jgi:hypothetical protein